MNLPIPIFRNEINALGDFKGGVKVARDFAVMRAPSEEFMPSPCLSHCALSLFQTRNLISLCMLLLVSGFF